ncbi:flavodoxin family protein [Chlorobaculum sp. MV4-Y]|uniref:flavodoxin family protein n=1 Tax=Chlorobaculum sp. MV4-Y TaxID=2976335 RepID=UPI0021B0519F|nr:flavodoxin family protein [Chlorobaculum sp. MV4-Y]UWX58323.1 flavodoxin family protein [Chlorobaculum sp. MV4-Y]
MKVIGINGSPRPAGNTSIMLKTVFESLEAEGIETELIQVGGTDIKGCRACYACTKNKNSQCSTKNDGFNEIFAKMAEADGMILGSPTYFADITPELKALIDRAGFVSRTNGQLFRHKVGAAVVSLRRGGGIHAYDSINHLFQICQMFMVGSTYWNLGFGGRDGGEVVNDAEGMDNMRDLGKSMAFLLKKLNA